MLLAAAAGGLFWHQLRRRRRFKTTWVPPITVPLAPRGQLALPSAASPFAGQTQGGPAEQAPWEQPTLVDVRRPPSLPPAENPFPGQDPPPDIAPPASPVTGRHAARQPRLVEGKGRKPR